MATPTKHRMELLLKEAKFKAETLPAEYLKEYVVKDYLPVMEELIKEIDYEEGMKK